MELFLVLTGVICAAAGFYFGQKTSKNNKELNRLESELKEKQAQLDAFRNKVTNHFEKTADLFNHVSDSYQSLYDHMAKSSGQLCASQTFQSLPTSAAATTQPEPSEAIIQQPEQHTQPPNTATNADAKTLFDANRLYNAHDYRNQAQEDNELEKEKLHPVDAKIVDIESAKEDRSEPALDYAIKEKGVINHNSLDVEGIKTS